MQPLQPAKHAIRRTEIPEISPLGRVTLKAWQVLRVAPTRADQTLAVGALFRLTEPILAKLKPTASAFNKGAVVSLQGQCFEVVQPIMYIDLSLGGYIHVLELNDNSDTTGICPLSGRSVVS